MNFQNTTVKKGTPSRKERNTLLVLFIATILLLATSVFLNICKKPYCANVWLDYFINIALGATASAAISLITIYIPYRSNILKAYQECVTKVQDVYIIYRKILLTTYAIEDLKEQRKTFDSCYEELNRVYGTIDYKFGDIQELIEKLTTKIPDVYAKIDAFIYAFEILSSQIDKIVPHDNESHNKLIQELFDYLHEDINKAYSEPELEEDFLNIIDSVSIYHHLLRRNLNNIDKIIEKDIRNNQNMFESIQYLSFFRETLSNYQLNEIYKDMDNKTEDLNPNSKQ